MGVKLTRERAARFVTFSFFTVSRSLAGRNLDRHELAPVRGQGVFFVRCRSDLSANLLVSETCSSNQSLWKKGTQ